MEYLDSLFVLGSLDSRGSSFLARPSGQASHSFANVLEEFDFCTRPYSNASVDRAGTPNPTSK